MTVFGTVVDDVRGHDRSHQEADGRPGDGVADPTVRRETEHRDDHRADEQQDLRSDQDQLGTHFNHGFSGSPRA